MRNLVLFILLVAATLYQPQVEAATLTDNGNGTVTDIGTGLVWQQGEPGAMTWGNAISYCEGLSLDGHSDWRLPNVKELESLTDDTRYNPSINKQFFANAYSPGYWSSTTYAGNPVVAWLVNFYYGYVSAGNKYYGIYVRCVRGGQSGSLGSLVISPSAPDFGKVAPGDSADLTLSVKNSGVVSESLGILSIPSDSAFSITVDSCSNATLAANAACSVMVRFAPTAVQAYTGTLTIPHGVTYGTVDLKGIGWIGGSPYTTYTLFMTQGGVPNNSYIGSVNGDNDYLSTAESDDLNTSPSTVTHALYPVEFYTQKTSDNSCNISSNGTPEPTIDTRQPLILVHGWQGGRVLPTPNNMDYPTILCEDEQLGETYWNNFIQYFKASPTLREKYRLYIYHYSSYKHVTFNARVLARFLERNNYIKSWIANGGKISILAHSMGGLVSRSLLEEHLSGEDASHLYQYTLPDNSTASKTGLQILDKLVTTATPHHGSPGSVHWWAYNAPNWAGSAAWIPKNLYTPGAQDLFWDNYDGVLAWVFGSVTWPQVYTINDDVFKRTAVDDQVYNRNLNNSGRLNSSTKFDEYYRGMLVASDNVKFKQENDYSGDYCYKPNPLDTCSQNLTYPASFSRYPNPWLSLLNYRFKQNMTQYSDKYVFLSGYNDGNNSSPANRLYDNRLEEFADDVVYSMGYINDWAVPLTSGSLDFSKEAVGLGPFDLNPKLFTYSVGGDAKSALFPDFVSDNLSVIHGDSVNGIPVRVFKDYNHDRMLNGGYKSSADDLLDNTVDSGFKDGGGRTLYLDQAGFKHPVYVSRTFPNKLIYEPVFQVFRSFLAPVTYHDLMQNGSFEAGSVTWTQTHPGGTNLIVDDKQAGLNGGFNDSAWYAHFGSNSSTEDILTQTVAIPGTALSAKLSFAYKVYTAETPQSTAYDTLTVKLFNTAGELLQTLTTYSNLDAQNPVWQSSSEYDLSAYKGQSVVLAFIYSSPIKVNKVTHFYVDEVRLITTEGIGAESALTVTLAGSGGGTVTSSPSGISCLSGTSGGCSANFTTNTHVSLMPSASSGSVFRTWGGDCSGSGNCTLFMDDTKTVTATFSLPFKAMIGATGYDTLNLAYTGASLTGSTTILALDTEFVENLNLNTDKRIVLKGGYKVDYSGKSGNPSILKGILTVGKGSMTMEGVTVR